VCVVHHASQVAKITCASTKCITQAHQAALSYFYCYEWQDIASILVQY